MDTTPEYSEMCQKANEIQQRWTPQIGDVCIPTKDVKWDSSVVAEKNIPTIVLGIDDYRYTTDNPGLILGDVTDCALYPEDSWLGFSGIEQSKCVFLPRQDQLQEMMMNDETDHLCLALNFSDWLKSILWNFGMQTMEQLWLVFLMFQKFGKSWNAEKKEWEKT